MGYLSRVLVAAWPRLEKDILGCQPASSVRVALLRHNRAA